MKWLIGIDEAGRGPLAGPVSVGAVIVPQDFDWNIVAGAKDSKKMTPKSRDELYEIMCNLREAGQLDFAVGFSSAALIDSKGIMFAVRSALAEAIGKIANMPEECEVRLDGGLRAPEMFQHQTTIIRGDASEPVISLASIAAKVLRDRLMIEMHGQYPEHAFDVHKGYGTLAHRRIIAAKGLSEIHRASFCSRLLNAANSV